MIDKSEERLKLALAYVATAADLHRSVITLRANMRQLTEAQQKLVAAAAVSVIERELYEVLELVCHYLTPLKEREPV